MSDQSLAELYGYDPAEFQKLVDETVMGGRARREAKRILAEEECPVKPIPAFSDLASMMKLPRVETEYRVEGWQPVNGRVVLAAQGKAGKTHCAHNLVRSLVDGDKWLGRWKVNPIKGDVAILDFEMDEAKARIWLEEQEIQNADRVWFCPMRGSGSAFNILDPGRRREWAEHLAERNIDYLVLDCLRPVLDSLGLDEHRDAGKFFGPFDELLHEAGIAEALVVHHMGHGGERSRGDSRILDWPDANWKLILETGDPNTSDRYISANGRDVSVSDYKIEVDTARRFVAVPGKRENADAENALLAVISVLREYGEAVSGRMVEKVLRESDHGRNAIRIGLRLGLRRGIIETRAGAHNATLYGLPQSSWARRMGGGQGDDNYHV